MVFLPVLLVSTMLAGPRNFDLGIVRGGGPVDDLPGMNTRAAIPTIALIGAPTDAGAGLRGASLGPEALRVAGLVQALRHQGLRVEDRGDLAGPINPQHPPREGCRHLQEVDIWVQLVADAVQECLAWGQLPVLMGGDHSVAIGSVAAVASHCARQGRPWHVVWLDAHADCNTPASSPSGHLHGMPVACLLGEGPGALVRGLQRWLGTGSVLQPQQLSLLGVRSTDPGEDAWLWAVPLHCVPMAGDDGEGVLQALAHLLAHLDARTHVHLSLDLDVLDPQRAPGVSTPVPGGLSAAQALACMRLLAASGLVGSVDCVELNPARDVRQQTARLAVALLAQLCAPRAQNTQSSAAVMNR